MKYEGIWGIKKFLFCYLVMVIKVFIKILKNEYLYYILYKMEIFLVNKK